MKETRRQVLGTMVRNVEKRRKWKGLLILLSAVLLLQLLASCDESDTDLGPLVNIYFTCPGEGPSEDTVAEWYLPNKRQELTDRGCRIEGESVVPQTSPSPSSSKRPSFFLAEFSSDETPPNKKL